MAAPPLITYTVPLTCEQVAALRQLLESAGFEFSPKPYTIFFAQKNKLSVAVYEKGPKLLLQGKGIEEFVSFELEPKILGEANWATRKCIRRKCSSRTSGSTKAGRAISLDRW